MNDDDLTEALRRTLRNRAGRLRPNPGWPPRPGQMPAPASRPDPWFRRARLLTGLTAAAGAVAVVAAVVAVDSGPGSSTSVRTRTAASPPVTNPVVTVPPTTVPSVAPAAVDPSTTAPVPTTAPPVPAVPAGFRPASVTFVSADAGWVLGLAPCATGQCAAVAGTTDGGLTWSAASPPPLHVPSGAEPLGIRFADARDGWVYTSDHLWSTHDGGATWQAQAVPGGSGAVIADLEASGGVAWLVVMRPGAGEGIYSTPAGADSWTAAPLAPGFGAGPVPAARIVLQGGSGWIVTENRTVVSGARNLSGAGWSSWTPPCSTANGAAGMAAASPTDLVAWCAEGTWGPPGAGTAAGQVWLLRSSDAGNTFSPVAAVPASSVEGITAAPGQPRILLVVTAGAILRSSDGGTSWSTAYRATGTGGPTGYVGYTTTDQAVALLGGSVLVSRDGGRTWAAATLQS